MNTILYLTDNTLSEPLATRCRELLVKAANGNPIISVSQRPIDLGTNLCIGDIGKCWLSLYKQILLGLSCTETEFVAIAEHDCLYTSEHFSWASPSSDTFYYNTNCWLVDWRDDRPETRGMYSFWHVVPPRTALSQLICSKDLLLRSTKEVVDLLSQGLSTAKGQKWFGEPGTPHLTAAAEQAASGSSIQLKHHLHDYATRWKYATFKTTNPNLDIRHGSNFTGNKRGNMRRYDLPPWGRFEDVLSGLAYDTAHDTSD